MADRRTTPGAGGSRAGDDDSEAAGAPAFLLSQLGAHAAQRFAEWISPLGLAPRHVGLLRWVDAHPGASQREMATAFGVRPSRIVVLVDELEERDLVRRASHSHDRRSRALHLTEQGEQTLGQVGDAFLSHQKDLLASLTPAEQATLADLLSRVAVQQHLPGGVHPGYRPE